MRSLVFVLSIVLAGVLGAAARGAETVVVFNPALGEFPEGIAFDRAGAMYVSLAPLGQIRRLDPEGSWSTVAAFDPGTTGLGVLGLAADRAGVLYAAVPSDAPQAHGVWAVAPGQSPRRLPGSEQILFPNGIALDHAGVAYVTDSILGAVWRIRPGGVAELWLQDESLEGLAILNPFPLGANGIAFLGGNLLVANTERKIVVEIGIDATGAPSEPRTFWTFAGPTDFLDGVIADVAGNVYVCVAGRNALVRITRALELEEVAGVSDGLSVPASLAFDTRSETRRTLYVTNLSLPTLVPVPAPSVVAIDVPLPGPPLP